MEPVVGVGILLAVAVVGVFLMWLQVGAARRDADQARGEIDGVRNRLNALESESKKTADSLETKRKETEELKERLKDVKKRRHEEKESARLKQDIQQAREEIEREMEKKLQVAREEAEISKAQVKKLSAEMESLRSRRPERVEPRPEAKQEPRPDPRPVEPRQATPEEVARAEAAEKAAAVARKKVEEMQEEVKKIRSRAETDRRVFLVQKGEVDVAKDKFRAMEARANALVLERDELKKATWLLEKELKSLKPTAERKQTPKDRPATEKAAASTATAETETKAEPAKQDPPTEPVANA